MNIRREACSPLAYAYERSAGFESRLRLSPPIAQIVLMRHKRHARLMELPQYDSYISRMLTYSQDIITLENILTVKSNELRSFWLRGGIVK
ncbi:hypothetical protein, partial [Peribacillus butanolivorans]|uniref:hypothetical protein n=1 Tax=Peribacillus butanolivorans TaxID=421767 RepID=UPI0039FC8B59